MKTILSITLLLFPFLSISQTIPEGLLGNWYPERYENYKTGKVSYAPQSVYRSYKISFTPTIIEAQGCNGIYCEDSIQNDILTLTCSAVL